MWNIIAFCVISGFISSHPKAQTASILWETVVVASFLMNEAKESDRDREEVCQSVDQSLIATRSLASLTNLAPFECLSVFFGLKKRQSITVKFRCQRSEFWPIVCHSGQVCAFCNIKLVLLILVNFSIIFIQKNIHFNYHSLFFLFLFFKCWITTRI